MKIAIITIITVLLLGCSRRQSMPEKYIAKQQVKRAATPAMVANIPVRPVTIDSQQTTVLPAASQPENKPAPIVVEPPKEQAVVRIIEPITPPPPPPASVQEVPKQVVAVVNTPNITEQQAPQNVKPLTVSEAPPSAAVVVRKPRTTATKPQPKTSSSTNITIVEAPRGYHIIVGSYSAAQRTSAEKMYRSLRASGHKAHLIADAGSGRIRISIECLDSPDAAATARDGYMVKLKRNDLWVLKY